MSRPGVGTLLFAWALCAAAVPAWAEDPGSWPLLRLRLEPGGRISALRVERRLQVELAVAGGVERVPARIARIDSLAGAVWLEIEPEQPVSPSDAPRIQGVLLREDHSRGGASVGWALGSLLSLWTADRALGDGTTLLQRRLTQAGAGIVGGLLGRLGGRRLGGAWARTRGVPVVSAHAVE